MDGQIIPRPQETNEVPVHAAFFVDAKKMRDLELETDEDGALQVYIETLVDEQFAQLRASLIDEIHRLVSVQQARLDATAQ